MTVPCEYCRKPIKLYAKWQDWINRELHYKCYTLERSKKDLGFRSWNAKYRCSRFHRMGPSYVCGRSRHGHTRLFYSGNNDYCSFNRVQGLGFKVQGLGFGVQGLGSIVMEIGLTKGVYPQEFLWTSFNPIYRCKGLIQNPSCFAPGRAFPYFAPKSKQHTSRAI